MSSYYTAARLEATRKTQLQQELSAAIQKLKEQMLVEHSNRVQTMSNSIIEMSVFATDDFLSGYIQNSVITGEMLKKEGNQITAERDELDFSELLFSLGKKPSKLEMELETWIKKIDDRPIISEKDEQDRKRVSSEIAKIVRKSEMDIEDKVNFVKMRVTSYLQGAAKLSESDIAKMKSDYYQYCAVCRMLEVNPTEKYHYRIKKETERMTAILEKRNQDNFIMSVIEDIMEELGCRAKDSAILDNTAGQIYSVDGHPLCDVFVGNDGSGIMFEPVGESKGGSLDRQRQIESSANSICSLYSVLEERAAMKGVILKRVYIEPSHIGEMYVRSDVTERSARKKQRKASNQKQQSFNSEG